LVEARENVAHVNQFRHGRLVGFACSAGNFFVEFGLA
jgi:hypothetical protein